MLGNVVIGVPLAFTILAVLVVALRIYIRARIKAGLGWDDWTMLLAVVIEIVNRGLSTTAAVYEYRVPLTPQDGFAALKYRRIALPFQVSVSVIARLSITILLLRLFGVHRWFKLAVVAQFCIVAMLSVAFIPMAFSEVKPIQALWDPSLTVRERWDPNIWVAYAAATQSVYTFSDLVLVMLPVMIIWRLNMQLHQKAGLVLIMALGLLTMAMSIMRTIWIVLSRSPEALKNYDQTAIVTLALLEGDMVIIIGCIPTLRKLMDNESPARSWIRNLLSRSGSDPRRRTKTPTADASPENTAAYHNLELGAREMGVLDQGGNVHIYTTNFPSKNRSEDYLVDQGRIRKTEQFSVT